MLHAPLGHLLPRRMRIDTRQQLPLLLIRHKPQHQRQTLDITHTLVPRRPPLVVRPSRRPVTLGRDNLATAIRHALFPLHLDHIGVLRHNPRLSIPPPHGPRHLLRVHTLKRFRLQRCRLEPPRCKPGRQPRIIHRRDDRCSRARILRARKRHVEMRVVEDVGYIRDVSEGRPRLLVVLSSPNGRRDDRVELVYPRLGPRHEEVLGGGRHVGRRARWADVLVGPLRRRRSATMIVRVSVDTMVLGRGLHWPPCRQERELFLETFSDPKELRSLLSRPREDVLVRKDKKGTKKNQHAHAP